MLFRIYFERKIYTMLPNDTPYPFYNIPDENYFGEFRELSNSIGDYEKSDKEKAWDTKDTKKTDDAFNEFSIFPMD